jgi:cellulose synthase operon protein C
MVSVGLILCGSFFVGCRSRDPNVRKQQYYNSAMKYFAQAKYREAEIELQNAIKIDPNFTEAHYQLAQCYMKQEIWTGVFTELNRVVTLSPKNWEAQLELGNMLLAAHQFSLASDRAKLVLQAQPQNVDAHTLLAKILASKGDAQGAAAEMQKVIALAPNQSSTYLSLAAVQLQAKQTSEAEASYQKAISLDPASAAPVVALGKFYALELRFPDAEQQFQRAIALEPADLSTRRALADVDLADGKQQAAIDVLKQAKSTFPDNPAAGRMLGDFYLQTGQADQAYEELFSLYKSHSQDGAVRTDYIQALIGTKRLDEAKQLNDEALKENPKSTPALLAESQIWLQQGRTNDAIPALESVVGAEPDNAFAQYLLGLADAQAGRLHEASIELQQAVKLQPHLIPAQKALARLSLDQNDLDVAKTSAAALIAALPASPDGYYFRAVAEARQANFPLAEADLKKSMRLAPQDPLAYTRLGDVKVAQKQYGDAEALYNQALQLNPAYVEAMNGVLMVYDKEKKPGKDAIARIQEQITRSPNTPAYYEMLGQSFAKEGDFANAQNALEKAVALDQKNVNAMLMLAALQASKGSMAQALTTAQHAVQQSPQDMRTYTVLAEIEKKSGNWQQAENTYQKALQINPQFGLGASSLAMLLLDHGGNVDTALSLAQTARQLMPDSPRTADSLAWAYVAKGGYSNWSEAVRLLAPALRQSQNDPNLPYHLGVAYERLKMPAPAAAQFRQVLKLDPDYEKRDEIRQYLASAK